MRGGEVEALADDGAEGPLVEDEVIRRRDDHFGLGIDLLQKVGRVGDAGGRVAADGLAQHLLGPQLGQMLEHELLVAAVRDDQKALGRNHRREPFEGVSDEGFARPQNIEELFGHRLSAFGPEAAADAARHDDAISVVGCHNRRINRFNCFQLQR